MWISSYEEASTLFSKVEEKNAQLEILRRDFEDCLQRIEYCSA